MIEGIKQYFKEDPYWSSLAITPIILSITMVTYTIMVLIK